MLYEKGDVLAPGLAGNSSHLDPHVHAHIRIPMFGATTTGKRITGAVVGNNVLYHRRTHMSPAFCIRCPLPKILFQCRKGVLDGVPSCQEVKLDGCHPSLRR